MGACPIVEAVESVRSEIEQGCPGSLPPGLESYSSRRVPLAANVSYYPPRDWTVPAGNEVRGDDGNGLSCGSCVRSTANRDWLRRRQMKGGTAC